MTPATKKKKKKCRKLAPFVCPECESTDCQIDHWDMPGIPACCFCGEWSCPKGSANAHRKECKRVAGHQGECKA